jgi:hypothetical protein
MVRVPSREVPRDYQGDGAPVKVELLGQLLVR